MNKIHTSMIGIFVVLSIVAIAAQVGAASNPTMSLIDTTVPVQTHSDFYLNPGGTINLTLYLQNVSSLWSWKVDVTWNSSVLQLAPASSVMEGPFLSTNGTSTTLFVEAPPTSGTIPEVSSTLLENSSVSGSGALLYVAFNPTILDVNTTIQIGSVRILNTTGNDIATLGPISKAISIHFTGDVNMDGRVDIRDISLVAKQFGTDTNSPNWKPVCDVNNDGKVNIKDISIVAKNFGMAYP